MIAKKDILVIGKVPFRRNAVVMVCIAVFTGLSFLALRSAFQTGDSLNYAYSAQTGDQSMFHPHHLIFTPIVHVLYRGCSAVLKTCDVITIAQVHNVVWAVVGLLSLYFLAVFLTDSLCFALSTTGMFFVAQGFFTYTTQVEVYVPALGALALLSAVLITPNSQRPSRWRIPAIVVLLTTAILYHQTNVLFAIPLAMYIGLSASRPIRDFMATFGLSGVLVFTAYLVTYIWRSQSPSVSGFFIFCLGYAYHPNSTWGSVENMSFSGLRALADCQIWNVVSIPCRFLREGKLLVAIIIVFIVGWNTRKLIRSDGLKALRSFLLMWLAVYYAFFLWWLPSEKEFFIVTLFPIFLLGLLTLRDLVERHSSSRLGGAACVLLIASAICLFIRHVPLALANHYDKGVAYRTAKESTRLVPDDFALLDDYSVQQNLKFYFGRNGVETAVTLLCFYRHLDLPRSSSVATSKPCLVPLWEIKPTRSLCGYDGYTNPLEWLSFIEWLFGLEYGSDGQVIACREFKIVNASRQGGGM